MALAVNGKNLVLKFITGQSLGYAVTTTTPPTSPVANQFYIASEDGDYTNFDPPVSGVTGVVTGDVLMYSGSEWENKGIAGNVTVACSTSCVMTVNQDFSDATCKDADSWVSKIEGTKSWEMSVDALYMDYDASGTAGFVDLSQMIVEGPNSCSVAFEEINNPYATTNGNIWTGTAVLTTASLTGDDNATATYSASLMGSGKLTFIPKV